MTGVDRTTYPFISGTAGATIAASGTQSGAVTLYGLQLVALQMPSSWNSADLTILVSTDGTTYGDMYNDAATEYSVTVGTGAYSRYIPLAPEDFCGVQYLKVRSGPAGSAVTQTAARIITLVVREV